MGFGPDRLTPVVEDERLRMTLFGAVIKPAAITPESGTLTPELGTVSAELGNVSAELGKW